MRKTPAILFATLCLGASAHALDFNLIYDSSINAQALAGFQAAAARWSNVFSNSMTVNLNIGYASLGSGILGQTGSAQTQYSYTSVRNALTTGATSALDLAAVSGLGTGTSYSYVTNGTSNGSGLHTTTTQSSQVYMTNANAKALGIYTGTSASDASITFSSNFSFDFNPNDGITSGQFDFVGVATHEIGHALGFISGVDILDGNFNAGYSDAAFNPYHSTLDLFRYSTVNGVATRSYAVGTASYFATGPVSVTGNPAFSTGSSAHGGDGSQASHFKDNLGLGILDPTAAPGELLSISQNDLNAFDAIGYNLRTQVTPEPSALAALGLGAAALLRRRKRA